MSRKSTPEDFWARFERAENGCLEFTGACKPAGYGDLAYRGERVYSHRLAWMLTNGPIPDGLLVCHKCDNPPCGDPEHLYLGTMSDNMHDAYDRGRQVPRRGDRVTHCIHDHEYTPENTYRYYDSRRGVAQRQCRICSRIAARTRRRTNPEAFNAKRREVARLKREAQRHNETVETTVSVSPETRVGLLATSDSKTSVPLVTALKTPIFEIVAVDAAVKVKLTV